MRGKCGRKMQWKNPHVGSVLNEGPFKGPFYKGAVLQYNGAVNIKGP